MNSSMLEEINIKVREMVKEKTKIDIDINDIQNDFLFGVSNGFDSTSLLEFILELEDAFNIIIPDEDLLPENFSSISKVSDYIFKMLSE